MGGFTKLFSDIVDSSIWDEDPETCKVWVTLLALSDADGFVRGSVGWLASKAKVSLESCEKAVAKFIAPDPASRTPDNEGRRIEMMVDGFLILNYLTFRDRLSTDSKAVATRERVKKHREKHARQCYVTQTVLQGVTGDASASVSASEVTTKGDARGKLKPESPAIPANLAACPKFMVRWLEWLEDRKVRRKNVTPLAAKRQLALLTEWGPEDAVKAIDNSITNGWVGLFKPHETNSANRAVRNGEVDRNANTLNAGVSYAGIKNKR